MNSKYSRCVAMLEVLESKISSRNIMATLTLSLSEPLNPPDVI